MPACAPSRLKFTGLLWLFFSALGSTLSHASQVRSDDLVVSGSACVGFDCVSSENLEAATLRLKENNTRIRLFNTSSPDSLGNSWMLEANDNRSGGPSVFRFKAQSLTQDTIRLSDGQDLGADCAVGDTFIPPDDARPAQIIVPLGEPVLQDLPSTQTINDQLVTVYTCSEIPWWTEELLLRIGPQSDDVLTLGYNSAPVDSAVSVGNPTLLRRISHVAAPQGSSDMLSVGALSLFPDRVARIESLRRSIDVVGARLAALESADADNDGVDNVDDAFPLDPGESVDSDGDGRGDNSDAFVNAVTLARSGNVQLTTLPQNSASGCSIRSFAAGPTDNQQAPGPSITQQADFVLSGCAPGETVTVTIDFGEPFPPRAAAFKVSGDRWELIAGASVDGQTITYTVTDNGDLDLDPTDGVIRDPVSVASAPAEPIPLPHWVLLSLALCMSGLGLRAIRRRRPRQKTALGHATGEAL